MQHNRENIDSKRFQDTLKTTTSTDEQQKVKIAFAEGFNFIYLKIS
jgi:hypothetical protein